MAFVQYQQPVQSTWGTGQYPSVPLANTTFQPQSTWGGLDFYRAHAPSSYDPNLFNHAWDRVRHLDAGMPTQGGLGVGINEAKHWHRRAYGGMNELSIMNPTEIGHAAAYEAFRSWRHNPANYEIYGNDSERQREALIGLAVAEASRLLSFAGRSMDQYTRTAASDSAAHTASYIFFQRLRHRDGEYSHLHRGRSRSRGHYDDYDGFDNEYDDMYPEDPYYRGRSRSRHRSHSRPRSYSAHSHRGYEGTPYPGLGPLPGVPSYAGSSGGGMIPPAPPLSASGYSSGYSSSGYYPPPSPYGQGPGSAYGGYGHQVPMSGYPASGMYPAPGVPLAVPLGQAPSVGSAYSYGSQPYAGSVASVPSTGSVGATPGMIVIHKSRRHKHRHHHRSRSRAGSE